MVETNLEYQRGTLTVSQNVEPTGCICTSPPLVINISEKKSTCSALIEYKPVTILQFLDEILQKSCIKGPSDDENEIFHSTIEESRKRKAKTNASSTKNTSIIVKQNSNKSGDEKNIVLKELSKEGTSHIRVMEHVLAFFDNIFKKQGLSIIEEENRLYKEACLNFRHEIFSKLSSLLLLNDRNI